MLTRIDLHDFKCFDLLKLPLSNLTLLSGTNASGKSSVLQALVLLHQTMRENEWSTRLMINGDIMRLGTVGDIVDKVNGRRSIEIGIQDSDENYHWWFSGERTDMSMKIDRLTLGDSDLTKPSRLQHLLPVRPDDQNVAIKGFAGQSPTSTDIVISKFALRLCDLTYITAERIGPREFYEIDELANVVGPAGEHAVSVLHLGRDKRVLDKLILEGVAPTLLRQVEARMQQFFPNCGLVVLQVPQANAVTLGLRTSDATDFHRPIHVGFGLTQILPIVVAVLSAKKDDILLIENPEVHLHPAGQALMGGFLAEAANAGVQVIVESHSDHILSGIRRAVKKGVLAPSEVAIHFFRPRGSATAQVVSPQIDQAGNIDNWPEGFFDQLDKDMNYFAGWDL